jgi:hypothetical protein
MVTDRQLIRIIYSWWDLQQSLSALTFLMEECDYDTKYTSVQLRRLKCFETTAMISLARPFETSRNRTTLSLKSIGVKLDPKENALLERAMSLRRKIIAHSDEEEMRFRAFTFPVLEGSQNFPRLQYDEGLQLSEDELLPLESLIRSLMHSIAGFIYELAQSDPERLNFCKVPASVEARRERDS